MDFIGTVFKQLGKNKQNYKFIFNKFKFILVCISTIIILFFSAFVFNKHFIKPYSPKIIEDSIAYKNNYSKETALKYSNFEIQGTSWLSFRDVPQFVKCYTKGKKTLDLGCGAGRSTRFLRNIGLDVYSVDISSEYIDQARRIDKLGKYFLIKNNKIPFKDEVYDFIFSSHVLLMIPTKNDLNSFFKEANRVLKKGGILIAVTGSEEMHAYDKKWLSYNSSFPENKNAKSGSIVKLLIKDVGVVFYDYNWTNEDYLEIINNQGFEVLKVHRPLGKDNEAYKWKSEKKHSPYILYVLRKNYKKAS